MLGVTRAMYSQSCWSGGELGALWDVVSAIACLCPLWGYIDIFIGRARTSFSGLWCGSTKARASVSAVLLHGGSCAITTARKLYNDAKGILVEKVYRSAVCELLGVLDRDQHLQYLPLWTCWQNLKVVGLMKEPQCNTKIKLLWHALGLAEKPKLLT